MRVSYIFFLAFLTRLYICKCVRIQGNEANHAISFWTIRFFSAEKYLKQNLRTLLRKGISYSGHKSGGLGGRSSRFQGAFFFFNWTVYFWVHSLVRNSAT